MVPGSYHTVDSTPVSFFDTFISIQKGMIDAGDVVFFVFIVYASFYTVLKTGALHAFIGWLLRILKGKEILMIPVFMYTFSLGGSIFGMYEETFGFIPLFVGLAIAMGYDAIVGVSMVCFGVAMGFAAAFMNPFTVGLAQKFAELPLLSGLGFRVICWFVMTTLAVIWTIRYANKIKKDPTKSLMYGIDMGALALDHDDLVQRKMTGRDRAILAVVVASVALLVWGVMEKGWYFDELAGLFLIMGFTCGALAGWGPSQLASTYVEGAKDIVFGALVIGLSRGILIVMKQGQIIDTVIYGLAPPPQPPPPGHSAPLGGGGGDALRADPHQLLHPLGLRTGCHHHAHHGTPVGPAGHHPADRRAGLPVRGRVLQHPLAHHPASGHLRHRPRAHRTLVEVLRPLFPSPSAGADDLHGGGGGHQPALIPKGSNGAGCGVLPAARPSFIPRRRYRWNRRIFFCEEGF